MVRALNASDPVFIVCEFDGNLTVERAVVLANDDDMLVVETVGESWYVGDGKIYELQHLNGHRYIEVSSHGGGPVLRVYPR